MPSFDIVSEIDFQEVRNAVDQANREIGNRYDFKGTDARVEHGDNTLTVFAASEFQVEQAMDILQNKLSKRGIDLRCLDLKTVEAAAGGSARQEAVLRHGIDQDTGRRLVKLVKGEKMKVQAAIQGSRCG